LQTFPFAVDTHIAIALAETADVYKRRGKSRENLSVPIGRVKTQNQQIPYQYILTPIFG
jgi:hypothetical protein